MEQMNYLPGRASLVPFSAHSQHSSVCLCRAGNAGHTMHFLRPVFAKWGTSGKRSSGCDQKWGKPNLAYPSWWKCIAKYPPTDHMTCVHPIGGGGIECMTVPECLSCHVWFMSPDHNNRLLHNPLPPDGIPYFHAAQAPNRKGIFFVFHQKVTG